MAMMMNDRNNQQPAQRSIEVSGHHDHHDKDEDDDHQKDDI